ncbi:uncharacterized protein EV422DRAFT_564545 [Fimicolochytrium jonesii]|uniref:uncharacterized protein n=1 Tax=Fimicolochytrium jonesii TaxID=1396493 RepID=UPI0022FE8352|nr:uncharacterized protein EV422DRAFT_564545 [Fimicolochytrium jonesii]KAI8825215.1 hypothetical protein EV422DRAFT_564545 [Fimicolochytrium jonesii]
MSSQPGTPALEHSPTAASGSTLLNQTVALDHLGPIVVNSDGTLSRIKNWETLTESERANMVRVLGKRNAARLAKVKAQEDSVHAHTTTATDIPSPSVSATLHPTHGFHPTVHFTVSHPSESDAALVFITLHLPASSFADRFELARTQWHPAVTVTCLGDADLEVPVDDPAARPNEVFVRVDLARVESDREPFEIAVPVHMRYQVPEDAGVYTRAQVGEWAAYLFDGVREGNTGVGELYARRDQAVTLAMGRRYAVDIPVGRERDHVPVAVATYMVILLGVVMVLRSLFAVGARSASTKMKRK